METSIVSPDLTGGEAIRFGPAYAWTKVENNERYVVAGAGKGNMAMTFNDQDGMECAASVTLTGPEGDRGVSELRVGFVQYATFSQVNADYSNKEEVNSLY